jgi:hypothetical protein
VQRPTVHWAIGNAPYAGARRSEPGCASGDYKDAVAENWFASDEFACSNGFVDAA